MGHAAIFNVHSEANRAYYMKVSSRIHSLEFHICLRSITFSQIYVLLWK